MKTIKLYKSQLKLLQSIKNITEIYNKIRNAQSTVENKEED